jgi:15-cis-phytoene synthase
MQSRDDLVTFSENMIRKGSKSFSAAARLFDRETRASVMLLYAWCRHCDDVIDGQDAGHLSSARAFGGDDGLAALVRQTTEAMDGMPMDDPVFAAFQVVVQKHGIDRKHPLDLLEGFAMDVGERNYETIDDTLSYCYHVAGVVGVMMAKIMGVEDERALDRASDLGIAFQLTNIVRDVAADHSIGRMYIPRQWLAEAGLTVDTLSLPQNKERVFNVLSRMIELAESYYRSSRVGLPELPLRSRWAVATARRVYRAIGREVRRRGPLHWDERVSTSRRQKLAALFAGGGTALVIPVVVQDNSDAMRKDLWTRPK